MGNAYVTLTKCLYVHIYRPGNTRKIEKKNMRNNRTSLGT